LDQRLSQFNCDSLNEKLKRIQHTRPIELGATLKAIPLQLGFTAQDIRRLC
jgi:hypothetical protein